MKLWLVSFAIVFAAACGKEESGKQPIASEDESYESADAASDYAADPELESALNDFGDTDLSLEICRLNCAKSKRKFSGYRPATKKKPATPPNVYTWDNPDPFGVDYNYYYIDRATAPNASGQVLCTELPGYRVPTLDEADLLQEDIAEALAFTDKRGRKIPCPILVWVTVDGQLRLKVIPSPQGSSFAPRKDRKGRIISRADKLCVQPVLTIK